jgi:hypothetical protein
MGLEALPPQEIPTYIIPTYDTLSDDKLENNRNLLRDGADPTQPIAHMFLRVREICYTAELAGPEQNIPDAYNGRLVKEAPVSPV